MAKRYIRINNGLGWANKPSTVTQISAGNLNHMDKGIDDLDNAIEAIYSKRVNNVVTTNEDTFLAGPVGKVLQDQVTELNKNLGNNNYEYSGKELPFTWAQIQAKCQSADWSGIRIGDYKKLVLTDSTTMIMEVAGIDTYYGYASNNKHNIDFISRDCLPGAYQINPTNTNSGGWLASTLYTTLNSTIYNTLPSDVKSVIGLKRMLLENKVGTDSTSWAWHDEAKLWLPAELEVFGCQSWSEIGYGTGNFKQYPIFAGSERHIIKSSSSWWTLSPMRASSSNFCIVIRYGNADSLNASDSLSVPLCFRVS